MVFYNLLYTELNDDGLALSRGSFDGNQWREIGIERAQYNFVPDQAINLMRN